MNTHIYINFIKGGQLHAGLNLGSDTKYVRPTHPESSRIMAFIDIHLRDEVPKTMDSFNRVIDEGFALIDAPRDAHVYEHDTTTGRFEFMTSPNYPKTADEAKAVTAKVYELLRDQPSAAP